MIYAETLLSLKRNGVDLNSLIIVSGLPIPEAPNVGFQKALDLAPEYILSIEDDMVLPDGAIEAMLKADKAVVAIDYPVAGGWGCSSTKGGVVQHVGLGCTLIKPNVLKAIGYPYFKTDKSINADNGEVLDIPMKYGGHDIWFGREVREQGFEMFVVPNMEAKHLRCEQVVRNENNNGFYNIYSLPAITNKQEAQ